MKMQSFIGLFVLAMIAWGLSENRRAVSWRIALYGILVQLVLAAIMIKVPLFKEFFLVLNRLVPALEEASRAGTSFVFGYLGGGALPFDEKFPGASFILALQAAPPCACGKRVIVPALLLAYFTCGREGFFPCAGEDPEHRRGTRACNGFQYIYRYGWNLLSS
mgnify:CR=1 FL=1